METFKTISELIKFKFLLQQTVVREIRVRYKQTFIGILWAVLQPLVFSCLFFLLFKIFKGNLTSKEHFVILYVSTSLWSFFSNSVTFATNSISNHPSLITKVYFPRIVFPLSFVAVNLIDLMINLVISAMLFIFLIQTTPDITTFLFVVPSLLFIILFACSCAVLFAGLNVFYRDFKYLVPIGLQIGMFATPVMYTLDMPFAQKFIKIIIFNPLSSFFDTFQKFLAGGSISTTPFLLSSLAVIIFFELALKIFEKFNSKMADVV